MITSTPHYGHQPVAMRRVADDDAIEKTGDFAWLITEDGVRHFMFAAPVPTADNPARWLFQSIPVKHGPNETGKHWGWDGNEDVPTDALLPLFMPSDTGTDLFAVALFTRRRTERMNKRIFLDVGANTGQSLAAALDPSLRFDEIVCFEPARSCWDKLRGLADARVRIERFGLWNLTCKTLLVGAGSKGGSMFCKDNMRSDAPQEICQFRRASEWFAKHIDDGDVVFLKLNCEGAECDILDDLLDSDEFRKVSFVMIDFDVRKISSEKHREAELRSRLEEYKFPRVAFCKQVMVGPTHEARIKNWLHLIEA